MQNNCMCGAEDCEICFPGLVHSQEVEDARHDWELENRADQGIAQYEMEEA